MDEDGDDETLLLATLEQLYCQQALINELFLTFSPLVPDSNAVYDAMMREEDRLNQEVLGHLKARPSQGGCRITEEHLLEMSDSPFGGLGE